MSRIYVFDHPLIQHKTALLRLKETTTKDFRDLAKEIGMLMGYEATRDLPLKKVHVETPMCNTDVNLLDGEDVAIVPILRAGLGMVDGMLSLIPNAKVGHVGLYRDPETHKPVEYYCKMPNEDIRNGSYACHRRIGSRCSQLGEREGGQGYHFYVLNRSSGRD